MEPPAVASNCHTIAQIQPKGNTGDCTSTRISYTFTIAGTNPVQIHDWLCSLLEQWSITGRTYVYDVQGHSEFLSVECDARLHFLTITADPPKSVTAEVLEQRLRSLSRLLKVIQLQQTCTMVELSDTLNSKKLLQTLQRLARLYGIVDRRTLKPKSGFSYQV